jgi:hypothetical protein
VARSYGFIHVLHNCSIRTLLFGCFSSMSTHIVIEVGIWRVQKRFPRYGVPIWSLWPNIRFLPSIVAEKNATKNEHIQNVCSMCMKINKVGKQEVGIWWVQKRLLLINIPPLPEGGACILFYLCPSVHPSVRPSVHSRYFSSHFSQ